MPLSRPPHTRSYSAALAVKTVSTGSHGCTVTVYALIARLQSSSRSPTPKQRNYAKAETPPVQTEYKNASTLVSTRFNAEEPDMIDADILLVSRDGIYFYAHRATLLRSNWSRPVLQDAAEDTDTEIDVTQPTISLDLPLLLTTITLDYPSEVLNLVLHFLYKFSVQSYQPSPTTLRATTSALSSLGYNPDTIFVPHSEPWILFLQAGVAEPLPMYALAAQYSLDSLAVAVSTFTLMVSPSDISDDLAIQMGPIYLRRLFCK
jgi:hypothetical protein